VKAAGKGWQWRSKRESYSWLNRLKAELPGGVEKLAVT
jgi:hypothetical protein